MKYIKSFIALLTFLIIPIMANASAVDNVDYEIDSVYVDAQVDMLGSAHVTEAIIAHGSINGFERTINFRNSKLAAWNGGEIDFGNSSIYNAKGLALDNVSSYSISKSDIDWKVLDKEHKNYIETGSASRGDTGVYTLSKSSDGITVKVFNPNKSGYVVYYFDYYIDQAVIVHNDVAELYWNFIPTDFDFVRNAHVQVVLPGSCTNETFRMWAHGPLTGDIAGLSDEKDNNLYRGVIANATNVYEGQGVDVRITFDKSLVAAGDALLTHSNQDALEKIIEVETKKADEANSRREKAKILYIITIVIGSLYLIGLGVVWYLVYKKYDREYKVDFVAKYYREFTGDYDVEVIDYLLTKNVSTNAMSASIMNLIYKKNLEVIDNPKDKKNPSLKLKNRDNLSAAEKKLVELLFDDIAASNGSEDEVAMKDIEKYSSKYKTADKFVNAFKSWKNKVIDAGVKEEFYEDNSSKKIFAALYLLIGGLIAFMMYWLKTMNYVILALIIITGVAFIIYLVSSKKWTKKGREHYLKWMAFKNFLKDFGSFKEKELPEIVLWEKYLVYATIFGLAKEVQKTMKIKLTEMKNVDEYYMNSWMFHHNYYIGNTISRSISNSYSKSVSTVNAELAKSSSSSGGGFGGGFSGGGGFGGGGGGGHGF